MISASCSASPAWSSLARGDTRHGHRCFQRRRQGPTLGLSSSCIALHRNMLKTALFCDSPRPEDFPKPSSVLFLPSFLVSSCVWPIKTFVGWAHHFRETIQFVKENHFHYFPTFYSILFTPSVLWELNIPCHWFHSIAFGFVRRYSTTPSCYCFGDTGFI